MVARVQLLFVYFALVSFSLRYETCARNTSDLVGAVRNLSVTVLQTRKYVEPKDVYNFLKLNVSWLPPSTVRQPSFYSVGVTEIQEKNGATECTNATKFYYIYKERLSALIPNDNNFSGVPELYIQPNCSYKVQVIANPSMNNGSEVFVKVPECVGLTCSCIYAKSSIPIPKVNVTQTENLVIVNWSPNFNASNVRYYAISIGVPVSKSTKGLPIYNVMKVGQVLANKTTFASNFKPNASSYKIIVNAIDVDGCSGPEGSLVIHSLQNHVLNHNILFIVIGIASSSALLGILGLILYYKHNSFGKNNFIGYKSHWMENILKRHNILYIRHELQEECIKEESKSKLFQSVKLIRELGTGQFGMVYLGQLDDANATLVAVKMSQNVDIDDENREQFIQEIEMMRMAGNHPHLVNLIGYCTQPTQPICILLEYMQGGDLLTYLHRQRKQLDDKIHYQNEDVIQDLYRLQASKSLYTAISDAVNSYKFNAKHYTNVASKERSENETENRIGKMERHRFLMFAKEIAMGMEHLEAIGIIHRDLAARNILLGADLTVKISDFGLSRNGIYVIKSTEGKVRRLPIRWMSPEALYDRTFSSKSDVWSFGVVLWEMSTLGGFPYSNVQDDRLLRYVIHENGRLERPDDVPTNVYELMDSCWAKEPEDRPTFAQLHSEIQSLIVTPSLEDTLTTVSNPCYAFSDSNKIT
ncbi:mast/stem cell growth factor receptor Kit-like [Ceratina calcarata]|uniref:Mast/stem cell growth factor receptor Kit-like n=1 Tax=Ceratina calcarata TaxID=156304 RepID=A0AAJ7S9B0_9HYME|nr:mast/stem cell growth factor receptor Kit-like [Ceratina calcarata]